MCLNIQIGVKIETWRDRSGVQGHWQTGIQNVTLSQELVIKSSQYNLLLFLEFVPNHPREKPFLQPFDREAQDNDITASEIIEDTKAYVNCMKGY